MSQMPINNTNLTGTPLYNYPQAQQGVMPQNTVSQPVYQNQNSPYYVPMQPIYQYPGASLYNPAQPAACSGVNIIINNPSGMGAGCNGNLQPMGVPQSPSTQAPVINNYIPAQPAPVVNNNITVPDSQQSVPSEKPVADSPISDNTTNNTTNNNINNNSYNGKTKNIVQLTDDYIKTVESYLRNPSAEVRKIGIKEIINRYEEDKSRYNDPALAALLNIALQDPDPKNRIFAMSPIASGSATGDKNTVKLLEELQKSDKVYGQEAKMANDALINAAQEKLEVPDYSPDKKK